MAYLLKATEGTAFVDDRFPANLGGAKLNSLSVGSYHFLRAASIAEARNEAGFFCKTIENNGGFDRLELPARDQRAGRSERI